MSFLSRLFFKPRRFEKPVSLTQEEDRLTSKVKEAKWVNSTAVTKFIEASSKQERDARLARQTINDVLSRTTIKAPNHAGNKK